MKINEYIGELIRKNGKDYDGENDPTIKKHDKMIGLWNEAISEAGGILFKYFDSESVELLDLKIEVLSAIKDGKLPKDIPRYYEIFELLSDEGQIQD